ncbi:MAG TPA: 3-hydroxyacyl-CoA dehydrogenase family protein, partial [Dehalococcoidia bacterium]|nr:3-hydroxyacyl-CoA dehydrogenase family protein [Dehalococcoidia bacterium]
LHLMVETALVPASDIKAILDRIRMTNNMEDAVAGADHIIESVPENLKAKQEIFARLDEICPPYVTLATNSSGLRADDCAAMVKNHPERILITHYWHPAPFIPLVEVIGGKRTDPAVLDRIVGLLRTMRKKVVLQKLELPLPPAGWANALQWPFEELARRMVTEKGCEPQMVDDIIRFGFGRRLPFTGMFIRYDNIGLDFFTNAAKARDAEPWGPFKERVERGETGMKSGKGFYDWPGDSANQYLRNFNLELIHLLKKDMERGDV